MAASARAPSPPGAAVGAGRAAGARQALPRAGRPAPLFGWPGAVTPARSPRARPQLEDGALRAASPGSCRLPGHLRVNERQPAASGSHGHRRKKRDGHRYQYSDVDLAGKLIKAVWKKKTTPRWHDLYTGRNLAERHLVITADTGFTEQPFGLQVFGEWRCTDVRVWDESGISSSSFRHEVSKRWIEDTLK